MNWICFTLMIILSLAGFWIGLRYVGQMRKKWWITIASLSLLVIILYSIFRYYPAWEYYLVPSFLSLPFEIISWIPFAMLFCGIAARRAPTKLLPMEMMTIAMLVFVYSIIRVNWIYLDNGVKPANFCMIRRVCIQSTPYTCGPASAVTLLGYFGILVTESEMAQASHTRRWLGTEMVPLARAIAERAGPMRLKTNVISADWQRLKELNIPCLVNIKYNLLVDHMIVVIKIREDTVIVADPMTGIDYWNTPEFLKKWRGSVIVITRN